MAETAGSAVIAGDSFDGLVARALAAYRAKRYQEAFDTYLQLANDGHVGSQVMVGWMLLQGLGVSADEQAASNWFSRAAALGSPQGSFYYGRYLTRTGRSAEARTYYRVGATAGYLPSMFWMGYSAARGVGTELNIDEALQYLSRAAKRGHLHALREIGVLDMKGARGPLLRAVGVCEFIAAVGAAFVLALIDRESDLLRA